MEWGIDFKADIFLSKQDYNKNIYQVEDKIEDLEDDINIIRNDLHMYTASNPKDIIPKDFLDSSIMWLSTTIKELLDELSVLIIQKNHLNLYLEYLKDDNRD